MRNPSPDRLPRAADVLDAAEHDEPPSEPEPGLVVVEDPASYGDLGTADRPGEEGEEIAGAAHRPPGLARSSIVMAIGTIVSRGTGFLRTAVLVAALGTHLLGDAYQTANMVPFALYDLLIGGLLASVFVPFLVKRRKQDRDGGTATEHRFFTAMLMTLLLITVLAVLAAEWLIRLYAGEFRGAQLDVAVSLARFLLAQIFFVGMSGVASAMLNSRERFAAPMWAPVMNNVTVVAVGLLFLWIAGPGTTPETITPGAVTLLGIGVTTGQVLQAAILVWSLRAAGFRWRPRLDLRGSGFGEALRSASWMMVYIAVAQAGLLVSTNVATRAGTAAAGSGLTAYKNAFVLFQLPYAIVAVSVITALLPKLSAHVADGRKDLVRRDFSRGLRLASVLLVPLSVAMVVFALPLSTVMYARGSASVEDARGIGVILMVFALMLLPFTLFQLMMRVFYALGDARAPGLIAIPAEAVHAVTAFSLLWLVPAERVVIGLPIAYGLYYVVGAVLAGRLLRRRLNGLDGSRILRTLLLLHVACLPAGVVAVAATLIFETAPLLSLAVGGATGGALYVVTARLLRVAEVKTMIDTLRGRFARP